jgi:hypothetical protein
MEDKNDLVQECKKKAQLTGQSTPLMTGLTQGGAEDAQSYSPGWVPGVVVKAQESSTPDGKAQMCLIDALHNIEDVVVSLEYYLGVDDNSPIETDNGSIPSVIKKGIAIARNLYHRLYVINDALERVSKDLLS